MSLVGQHKDQFEVDGPSLETRWERGLVVISIPHGAAFGAFYGNYDFSGQGSGSSILYISFFLMLLPLTTAWLFTVHDLLRNAFLRAGHMGRCLKFKHSFYYYCSGLSPLLLLALSQFEPNKNNKAIIVLLLGVMFSWAMCATMFSNSIYLRVAKALGMKVDD